MERNNLAWKQPLKGTFRAAKEAFSDQTKLLSSFFMLVAANY